MDDNETTGAKPEPTGPGINFRAMTTTDGLLAAHAKLAEEARALGLSVDNETNFIAVETGQLQCEKLLARIEAKRAGNAKVMGQPEPGIVPSIRAKARKPRAPKTKAAVAAQQPATAATQEDEVTSKTKKAKSSKGKGAKKPAKAKTAKSVKAKTKRASNGAAHGSKTAEVARLLARAGGCTAAEVLKATGWPSVSMPALAKNIGVKLTKKKEKGSVTQYFGK